MKIACLGPHCTAEAAKECQKRASATPPIPALEAAAERLGLLERVGAHAWPADGWLYKSDFTLYIVISVAQGDFHYLYRHITCNSADFHSIHCHISAIFTLYIVIFGMPKTRFGHAPGPALEAAGNRLDLLERVGAHAWPADGWRERRGARYRTH